MNEGAELDLLVDLSRLLRKYGPETFERLVEQLASAAFVERLTALLSASAIVAREAGRRQPSPGDYRLALLALGKEEPEKGALLVRLYDGLLAKRLLPKTQGLRELALRLGLDSFKVTKRPKAVIDLLERLRSLSLQELQRIVSTLNAAPPDPDRSLESWARIILDKDPRGRKAQ